ncbi:MAG TPA: DUF4159 domain-containing protein [Blastocatellia bacterium]|nr:DUF4159 domain-containing protein [Blastocatellia bacterium]
MTRLPARRWLLTGLLLLTGLPLAAAAFQRSPRLPDYLPATSNRQGTEFTFARLIYPSFGWYESWTTDYPKADEQFIYGLRGWAGSLLAIADDPTAVAATDPKVFDYPLIYAVEPGRMSLSPEDAARLREYLERGGMLMLDDFWGEREWWNVQRQMKLIFPDREIQELPLSHPLFHCYFDINEVVQVPNVDNWIYYHRTDEKGGVVPYYEGILDEQGRVMVFIARNTDNGDAWEWIDHPQYPLRYGLAAYKIGMNVIVYAMTH